MISKISGSMPLNTINKVNKIKMTTPKSDLTLPNQAPKRINFVNQFRDIIAELFPFFDPEYNKLMTKVNKYV